MTVTTDGSEIQITIQYSCKYQTQHLSPQFVLTVILRFHDLKVYFSSLSSIKISSFILPAAVYRSCINFSLTSRIPSSLLPPSMGLRRCSELIACLGVVVEVRPWRMVIIAAGKSNGSVGACSKKKKRWHWCI